MIDEQVLCKSHYYELDGSTTSSDGKCLIISAGWVKTKVSFLLTSNRRLRLWRLQQKQIKTHPHYIHRRATSSTTGQLPNRQQSRRSRPRTDSKHDGFKQESHTSLVSKLSRATKKAQKPSRMREVTPPNPLTDCSAWHLYDHIDYCSCVKRGPTILRIKFITFKC